MDNIFSKAVLNNKIQRSAFDRRRRHKTTFNSADIVPIFLDQKILPNDTVSLDMSFVVRSGTPIAPVLDDSKITVAFFFIPMRILWTHTKQFYGENDTSAWTQSTEYRIPETHVSGDDLEPGSIGSYMGLPRHHQATMTVSELPLRAYWMVYNEWFRNQAITAPKLFTLEDSANTNITYKMDCAKATKFNDYFTSCLPSPQKGNSVTFPLASTAPVKINSSVSYSVGNTLTLKNGTASTGANQLLKTNITLSNGNPAGSLVADLSEATSATINQLRYAIAMQHFLENDALGGTRFREFMYNHYGATSAGADEIPQLLCVKEFDVNVDQVLGQSDSNLGNTGAYSHTSDWSSYFTYTAIEPGILLGVACVRTVATYSQGLHRDWTANGKYQQFYPEFAAIGNQPVDKSELDFGSQGVFGYQEAYAEYRYFNNLNTGYMDKASPNALSAWTYQQVLPDNPVLNDAFIQQSQQPVADTLKTGSTTHQYLADFFFDCRYVRPMPMYSIPGMGTGI